MKRTIKTALRHAAAQLPQPSFEQIAALPVEKLQIQDEFTQQYPVHQTPPRAKRRRLATVCACCALLVLTGVGVFRQTLAVDSIIVLDINPSFEIRTSKNVRVLRVKALNEDAEEFLTDQDFRGQTLDDTVESLFRALGKSRYLNAQKNSVLVSVHNDNAEREKKLEDE
ncbi:MAG: hypothetical protein RR075_02605, partial [Pygmaiobacter sp.]